MWQDAGAGRALHLCLCETVPQQSIWTRFFDLPDFEALEDAGLLSERAKPASGALPGPNIQTLLHPAAGKPSATRLRERRPRAAPPAVQLEPAASTTLGDRRHDFDMCAILSSMADGTMSRSGKRGR